MDKAPKYLPQLDGLRALSVMAVAWSHWRASWLPEAWLPWGEIGVEIFFVISGFLITGILLDNRSNSAPVLVLKQFYVRRFLRIFPLFYATIIVALVLGATSMAETWYWHASYLSNIYFYLHGWQGQLSHFWSLAVEEQFYLCWPFLMIFLPSRLLLPAILSSILIAPVFEFGLNQSSFPHAANVSASILTPSCLDALGMGAFLAFGVRKNFPMKRILSIFLLAGVVGLALFAGRSRAFAPFDRLAEDCVLGWLVFSAAQGFGGFFGRLLQSAPLSYLGKISYGLYIIHNFAVSLCESFISMVGSPAWLLNLYNLPPLRMLAFAGITIGLAAYSWHRFEKPINDLKRKFPYPASAPHPIVNPPRRDIPDPSP